MQGRAWFLPVWLTEAARRLSLVLAIAGGATLVAVTALTDLSIAGRTLIPLGFRPIPGDFELVEAGTAFAIFCFMPWCQFNRQHATVDIFTAAFPPVVVRAIDVVVDLAFAVIVTVLVWRMALGLWDKFGNGQATFILQMPVWWTYAAGMIGGLAWALITYWCLLDSVAALGTGRDPPPAGEAGP
jgi:TRAP-type C4-dicarboxylate transport system permease small subunit